MIWFRIWQTFDLQDAIALVVLLSWIICKVVCVVIARRRRKEFLSYIDTLDNAHAKNIKYR
jgi:hypothetical protein